MARLATIKFLRTSRANLNSQAAADGLIIGEPYLVTDETPNKLCMGTAANAYIEIGSSQTVAWTLSGSLSVGTGAIPIPMTRSGSLVHVHVAGGTAPTGQAAIFDVNKNGTSVFPTSTKPNVAAGSTLGGPFVPDTLSFSSGDVFTVDCDQVGNIVAGANFVVALEYI